MYFYDLKWICYDFSKIYLFLEFLITVMYFLYRSLTKPETLTGGAMARSYANESKVDWQGLNANDRRRGRLRPPWDVRIALLEPGH
jgi:hypothetical protein